MTEREEKNDSASMIAGQLDIDIYIYIYTYVYYIYIYVYYIYTYVYILYIYTLFFEHVFWLQKVVKCFPCSPCNKLNSCFRFFGCRFCFNKNPPLPKNSCS